MPQPIVPVAVVNLRVARVATQKTLSSKSLSIVELVMMMHDTQKTSMGELFGVKGGWFFMALWARSASARHPPHRAPRHLKNKNHWRGGSIFVHADDASCSGRLVCASAGAETDFNVIKSKVAPYTGTRRVRSLEAEESLLPALRPFGTRRCRVRASPLGRTLHRTPPPGLSPDKSSAGPGREPRPRKTRRGRCFRPRTCGFMFQRQP